MTAILIVIFDTVISVTLIFLGTLIVALLMGCAVDLGSSKARILKAESDGAPVPIYATLRMPVDLNFARGGNGPASN